MSDLGQGDSSSLRDALGATIDKEKMARDKGALAVIERYRKNIGSWERLQGFFTRQHVLTEQASGLPVFIVSDSTGDLRAGGRKAAITVSGTLVKNFPAENVMGWVEGTDPVLKNQFIVPSAHYCHRHRPWAHFGGRGY